MIVDNPLPAEIKVNEMLLITEGSEFQSHPATLALPAQSGNFPFMLLGTPSKPGVLVIVGYKVEILSITSIVRLHEPITVEVTPPLPILRLASTLPRVASGNGFEEDSVSLFTSANLYHGHCCNGKLILQNAGHVDITKLDIEVKHPKEKKISLDHDVVQSSLPLLAGDTLSVDVVIMPAESWKYVVDKELVEVSLTIKYSCDDGTATIDYNREISWVTYVKVMPSVHFSNFRFSEVERQPTCLLLTCDAMNATTLSMTITCEVQLPQQYESHLATTSSTSSLTLGSKKCEQLEIMFPRLLLPPPTEWRRKLEDVYQDLICDSLHLQWRLTDTSYNGVAYIHDINITPQVSDIRIFSNYSALWYVIYVTTFHPWKL